MSDEALIKADASLRKLLEEGPEDSPVRAVLVLHEQEAEESGEEVTRSDFPSRAAWKRHLVEETMRRTPEVSKELSDRGVEVRGEPMGELLTVAGSVRGLRDVLEMTQVKAALLDRKLEY